MVVGASTSFAAGSLSFVDPGPQDAQRNAVITTTDFGTSGPIQVQITGGPANAMVTVSIDPDSPDDEGGELTGGGPVRARQGVASFSNLKISKHGTYKLRASADGMSPATSNEFRIWDAVCSNGNSCNAGSIVKNSTALDAQQTVATAAPPGSTVALSLGDESIDCDAVEAQFGVVANHAPLTASLFATTTDEKLVTITVSSFYDTNFGDPPGAAFYQVCYIDDQQPWVDRFDRTIPVGEASLLPDCKAGGEAPCVVSRTKESKSRNVKIVVRLLDARCR
jgi:hypothetical protein